MSTGERMSSIAVREIVVHFMERLAGLLEYQCIAGSIRRGKPMVGDAEVVIEPKNLSAVWNRVEGLLNQGIISQADYGAGAVRWGKTYRGLLYRGVKIELFVCDENNRGYVTWLRTGASQKNTYVMTRLKEHQSAVRMHGGYVWHVSYQKSVTGYSKDLGYAKLGKLIVPDEYTLYWLLGMDVVEPRLREELAYRSALERWVNTPSGDLLEALYVSEPKQMSLF